MTGARLLWMLYVVAILAISFWHCAEKIASSTGGPMSRFGPPVGAIVIALGIIGLTVGIRIGRRWMWATVLVLAGAAALGMLVLEFIVLFVSSAPVMVHLQIISSVILLALGVYGMHRYAFRRPALWRRDSRDVERPRA